MQADLTFILLSSLAAFLACFFSAISGGGAGLILMPILSLLGIPFVNALACNKFAVAFIGIGSGIRYYREKLIDWRVFWMSALIPLPAVILGTILSTSLPSETMKSILGVTIIITVIFLVFFKDYGLTHSAIKPNTRQLWILCLCLLPVGFYLGWLGAGAGIYATLVYVYILKYDQLHATAVMLTANGIFWNMTAASAHVAMGHVIWRLAPGLALGAVAGSYAGASLGIAKGNKFVRYTFLFSAGITGVSLLLF